MPTMTIVKCSWCKQPKSVRTADVKRGWGKFCSKSCKAKYQEKKTGQYRNFRERIDDPDSPPYIGHPMQSGYFGHGQE